MSKSYSKLFEFSSTNSWDKKGDSYISQFYKEYKLELINENFFWCYKVYSQQGYSYTTEPSYEGIVRLNLWGKFMTSWVMFIICLLVQKLVFDVSVFPYVNLIEDFKLHYLLYSYYIIFSHLCASRLFFNYKTYKTLKRVRYAVNHQQEIKEKEKEEILDREIINIINIKVSSNPKLARKTKLNELNKKSFLDRFISFFKQDDSLD